MRLAVIPLLLLGLSQAQPRVETIAYAQDSVALEGALVLPPGKAITPGIVLVPDWMGVTPEALALAKRVAEWGYTVFVADVYGKGKRPKTPQEAGKLAGALKGDVPLLRKRATAAWMVLRSRIGVDSGRMAAMGFCFGGTTALELARSGASLKGVVSIHGNLNTPTPEDAKKIKGKVLVLHGAEDPFVPPEQIQNFMDEMRAAKADWEMVYYGGAVHAFTNPKAGSDPKKGVAYHAKADQRAFSALKAFLAENL